MVTVRTRIDFSHVSDPGLDLTLVGDQLALEVALICKDLGKAEEKCDFASQFYFDKKLYTELEGGEEECDSEDLQYRSYIKERAFLEQYIKDCGRQAVLMADLYSPLKLGAVTEEGHDSQDFASQFYLDKEIYFDQNKFQDEEVFVGFQVEASALLQQLASITKKRLEIICIVGMAGLGKTTLAKRLYNDPYIVSYLYVRAWVTCSHVIKEGMFCLEF